MNKQFRIILDKTKTECKELKMKNNLELISVNFGNKMNN
jgi:hypothetical protein